MQPRSSKRTMFNTESESLVLATAHYAHATTTLLEDLEIPYIPRDKNPPNCPQLRPIEKFWAILEEKVYKDKWEAVLLRCCSSA